jgi:hypothetical protein
LALLATGCLVGSVHAAEESAGESSSTAKEKITPRDVGHTEERGVCPVCGWVEPYTQITPWLKWGGDFRAREIYQKNHRTLNDDSSMSEWHWQRYRTRVWAEATPLENLTFNVRLVNENRHYCQVSGDQSDDIRSWNCDEAIIDKLNVEWKKALGLPMTVKVGRQDIKLGDGWLFLDGTPLDGSRTFFLDAARLTYYLDEWNTSADVIFFHQAGDSDAWLTPINDRDKALLEYDATGGAVWVTNKSLANTEINGYFIYKHENWEDSGDFKGDVYTVGGRVVRTFSENLLARGELAGQFGNRDGMDICALGANTRMTYALHDAWDNRFHLEYEYRSGDDDDTQDTDEAFDILFGRYPQFGNLYNGYIDRFDAGGQSRVEGRPAASANIHRVGLRYDAKPIKDVRLAMGYHLLFADENNQEFDTQEDRGCFRGQLFTAVAEHQLTSNITHHVLGEYFCPGDYYADSNNDPAVMLRYQIVLKW